MPVRIRTGTVRIRTKQRLPGQNSRPAPAFLIQLLVDSTIIHKLVH